MSAGRIFLLVMFLVVIQLACGANILGICPFPSVSHQVPLNSILKLLLGHGHKVTLIATTPLEDSHENYTYVDISYSMPFFAEKFSFQRQDKHPLGATTNIEAVSGEVCEQALNSTTITSFLSQQQQFDVVIMETLMHLCFLGLVHKLGSPPVIGYVSLGGISPILQFLGNEVNPATSPDVLVPLTNRMTFLERFYNWVHMHRFHHLWNRKLHSKQNNVIKRVFGDGMPDVDVLLQNISALFVSTYWAMENPRQLYPNIIEISGIHVRDDPGKLPEDIQEFMDSAEEGVVYMSLGSNIQSSVLPHSIVLQFVKCFSSLRQKVVWKWESEGLTNMPGNVLARSWLPQQAILAHPKTRVFITQGGEQSLQEAVFHGVPFVVIPFVFDQSHKATWAKFVGVGKHLPMESVTSTTLCGAVAEVINNSSYLLRIRTHSSMLRDHRRKSIADVLWWTEFIVKHGNVPELRPATLLLEWYQLHMLDIYGLFLSVVLAGLFALYRALKIFANMRHYRKCKME